MMADEAQKRAPDFTQDFILVRHRGVLASAVTVVYDRRPFLPMFKPSVLL
ncbi:MAG: hypothetical protein WDM96_07375 [Lacunisphaera sp.]